MCGRAYFNYTIEELEEKYSVQRRTHNDKVEPRYNLAPSQIASIIYTWKDRRQLSKARWGLIPHWAKDEKIAYRLINARAETLEQKRSFSHSLQKQRGIVPISGFYEWQRTSNTKTPYAIRLKEKKIMSVAALWDLWQHPNGKVIASFTLITTPANKSLEAIHERMPAVLKDNSIPSWLDSNIQDSSYLKSLVLKNSNQEFETWPVSHRVNQTKNEGPDLLDLTVPKKSKSNKKIVYLEKNNLSNEQRED